MQNSQDKFTDLNDLIRDIKIAMLTTHDERGGLRCRPMATLKHEFDGDLWFFTRERAGKVEEIQHDDHVNVAYAHPGDQRYVSVTGRATVVRDKVKNKEFWNPLFRAWFPKGLDDPDMALLKVKVERAELWDAPPGPVVHVFGLAKAAITGQKLEEDERTHRRLGFDETPAP